MPDTGLETIVELPDGLGSVKLHFRYSDGKEFALDLSCTQVICVFAALGMAQEHMPNDDTLHTRTAADAVLRSKVFPRLEPLFDDVEQDPDT